jgi:predicted nucleotidyltransferase
MRNNLEKNVLATLSYSDIFDSPLTLGQIHKFLVGQKANKKEIKGSLIKLLLTKKIGQDGRFYFLSKREKIVKAGIEREIVSQKKLKIARKAAKILRLIPSVKFIGISGALACKNSKEKDDIDFLIITKSGQVWTTRLLVTLLLDLLGKRRKPNDKKFKDKICLNLFLDENDLALGPKDLFFAREIVQLEPLYDKDSSYKKFLSQNLWIREFLPNWKGYSRQPPALRDRSKSHKSKNFLVSSIWLLEAILRNLQLLYMRKRITCEKLSKTQIFFHPIDVHYKILAKYQKKIAQIPS